MFRLFWPLAVAVLHLIQCAQCQQQYQQQHQLQSSSATGSLHIDSDKINRDFYGRVRELLDEKYPQASGAAASVTNTEPISVQHAKSNVANVDTTHLDSPPKPKEVKNWPQTELQVGQITAVSINADGNPVLFHRANRVWAEDTFNETDHYQFIQDGPIKEDTILTLDAHTGKILDGTGANQFYMPHGMTIDRHGHTWVTDVAMHQVFKYKPNSNYPTITIGRFFQPGSTPNHLCKPTAVAIASTGEIFVADGYCNNRILKFNAAGRILRIIPQPPEFLSLQVPHGLTLLEHLDLLCIADRENMRVVCPRAGLKSSRGEGTPAATIQEPDLGRVFDVAAYGDYVYAINGPTSPMIPVRGFTIDPRSEQIIDHWGNFENPHSIAFSPNGSAMYVGEIGPNKITKFELV